MSNGAALSDINVWEEKTYNPLFRLDYFDTRQVFDIKRFYTGRLVIPMLVTIDSSVSFNFNPAANTLCANSLVCQCS